jgi:transaldolase
MIEQVKYILDKLAVNFSIEILKIVPGRVSTEVDARLSFDTDGTIKRAQEIVDLYQESNIGQNRILIKIASTWEGIKAAAQLEKKNIHCNLTLIFCFEQAVACADAGVTLISPFVGRIFDWYKKHEKVDGYEPGNDPGVKSVTHIYNYYKKHEYKTVIMGASFRNIDEILELAGCDYLTISPQLMKKLQHIDGMIVRKLDPQTAKDKNLEKIFIDEMKFRWQLNENAMATEKLAEGIRNFTLDTIRLEEYIHEVYKTIMNQ